MAKLAPRRVTFVLAPGEPQHTVATSPTTRHRPRLTPKARTGAQDALARAAQRTARKGKGDLASPPSAPPRTELAREVRGAAAHSVPPQWRGAHASERPLLLKSRRKGPRVWAGKGQTVSSDEKDTTCRIPMGVAMVQCASD